MPGLENQTDAPKVVDEEASRVERLKRQTKEPLELLRKQTERLELFKPDIDLVMQWYEIKSSHLSKLSHYYGQKSWYQRQVLHGELVAGAVVLGFAVHALAFFALIAAYYKGTSLLADHYAVEESNKEAMKQSLAKLSERLEQSIQSFNEMETKLDRAFTAMEEQSDQLSSAISDLNQEAIKLHTQIAALEETVKQLQEQQKRIASTTDQIHNSGDRLGKEIESLSSLILEKNLALNLLTTTIDSVVKDAVEFKNEVSTTGSVVGDEARLSKKQIDKCDFLDERLEDSGTIKALKESIDKYRKQSSDDDDIILRAQRAIAKPRTGLRVQNDTTKIEVPSETITLR